MITPEQIEEQIGSKIRADMRAATIRAIVEALAPAIAINRHTISHAGLSLTTAGQLAQQMGEDEGLDDTTPVWCAETGFLPQEWVDLLQRNGVTA